MEEGRCDMLAVEAHRAGAFAVDRDLAVDLLDDDGLAVGRVLAPLHRRPDPVTLVPEGDKTTLVEITLRGFGGLDPAGAADSGVAQKWHGHVRSATPPRARRS